MSIAPANPIPDERSAALPARRLLALDAIDFAVAGRNILNNVSLTVDAGEIVTLIGPNGSGKTTLVRLALGLMAPVSGRIARAPGLRIGYVPQAMAIDDVLPLTVYRFLTLGARAGRGRCQGALDEVGAGHLMDSPIQAISGGELRRVLLARALLRAPRLLVLDEPAQGVDLTGQVALYRLIADLRRRHGCGVLLVSHDLHLVMAQTDRVICLNHHVCCHGTPESVARHPAYLDLFGADEVRELAIYTHSHDHAHTIAGEVVAAPPDAKPGEGGDG